MTEPLVALQDVFCIHRTSEGDAAALQGTTLKVPSGEVLCVLGPSGAGKSTMLRVIAGLQLPSAGIVNLSGQDMGRLPRRRRARLRHRLIGFLGQRADTVLPPDAGISDAIGLPLALRGVAVAARQQRVRTLIRAAGLDTRADALPAELSGGERQRAALCAALAHRPKLLLADEPTGELDAVSAAAVLGLIGELARAEGATVILVSHDPDTAAHADRAVRIRDGRIVEDRRNGAGAFVVGRGGWLQLPQTMLAQAGIGEQAVAEVVAGGVIVRPAQPDSPTFTPATPATAATPGTPAPAAPPGTLARSMRPDRPVSHTDRPVGQSARGGGPRAGGATDADGGAGAGADGCADADGCAGAGGGSGAGGGGRGWGPATVQLRALSCSRGRGAGATQVLRGLDLTIGTGRLTVVTGRSGAGKTTLLRLLAGLDRSQGGEVVIDGLALGSLDEEARAALRRQRIGYLPQEPNPIGFLSAEENVALALRLRGCGRSEAAERAAIVLARVGLADRARQRVARLSAGEGQRVALARALASARGLLIADEPTSRLDEANAMAVAQLLAAAAREDAQTVICATHDPEVIRHADDVVTL